MLFTFRGKELLGGEEGGPSFVDMAKLVHRTLLGCLLWWGLENASFAQTESSQELGRSGMSAPSRWLGEIFIGHHQRLLSRKPENPRIASLDILPEVQFFGSGIRFVPALEGHWGLYGSHLRLSHGFFDSDSFTDRRSTLDWQILVFNPVFNPLVHIYLGTGIAWDLRTDRIFNEHSVGFHVYFGKAPLSLKGNGRYAGRYRPEEQRRLDAQGQVSWWFIEGGTFQAALSLGGAWRSWRDRSDTMSLLGMQFNLN